MISAMGVLRSSNRLSSSPLLNASFRVVSGPSGRTLAPEYKLGTVLCFMHKDSPERATLNAAGLGSKTCVKSTLASDYSKTIHAEHRHRQEWTAYQRYVGGVKEAAREDRQEKQLEATLSIAKAAQGAQAVDPDCPSCDWKQKPTTKNLAAALAAHAREKHPPVGAS